MGHDGAGGERVGRTLASISVLLSLATKRLRPNALPSNTSRSDHFAVARAAARVRLIMPALGVEPTRFQHLFVRWDSAVIRHLDRWSAPRRVRALPESRRLRASSDDN